MNTDLDLRDEFYVARDYRGTRLYLAALSHAAKYFRWASEPSEAIQLTAAQARTVCDEASRENGVECFSVDTATFTLARRARAAQKRRPSRLRFRTLGEAQAFAGEQGFRHISTDAFGESYERSDGATALLIRAGARMRSPYILESRGIST